MDGDLDEEEANDYSESSSLEQEDEENSEYSDDSEEKVETEEEIAASDWCCPLEKVEIGYGVVSGESRPRLSNLPTVNEARRLLGFDIKNRTFAVKKLKAEDLVMLITRVDYEGICSWLVNDEEMDNDVSSPLSIGVSTLPLFEPFLGSTRLSKNLQENRDYVFISSVAWERLMDWFGGGPCVYRIPKLTLTGAVDIDIRGIELRIALSISTTVIQQVMSRHDTVGMLKARLIQAWSGIPLEFNNIRLWDCYGGKCARLLDGNSAKLGSFRLIEGQTIMIEMINFRASSPTQQPRQVTSSWCFNSPLGEATSAGLMLLEKGGFLRLYEIKNEVEQLESTILNIDTELQNQSSAEQRKRLDRRVCLEHCLEALYLEYTSLQNGLAYFSAHLEEERGMTSARTMLECKICTQRRVSKAIIQCGHMLCENCLSKIKLCSNQCPMCRQTIELVLDLFF